MRRCGGQLLLRLQLPLSSAQSALHAHRNHGATHAGPHNLNRSTVGVLGQVGEQLPSLLQSLLTFRRDRGQERTNSYSHCIAGARLLMLACPAAAADIPPFQWHYVTLSPWPHSFDGLASDIHMAAGTLLYLSPAHYHPTATATGLGWPG